MKIGLVRHFKVLQPYSSLRRMTSDEFVEWLNRYDTAQIQLAKLDLGAEPWDVCYASDLPRAEQTARHIYPGQIIITPLLREITINPFANTRLRLPVDLWNVLGRAAWALSHPSQVEGYRKTRVRIRQFLELALSGGHERILVVSHAAFMWYLRQEMVNCGFSGEYFTKAENGRLYLVERKSSALQAASRR